MANYYEILGLGETASATEIERALDEQYHKWRRLVTHHDPQVVNRANQALQSLEKIRATLTNSRSRAVYDDGLGLGEAGVAGLEDPSALLAKVSPEGTSPNRPLKSPHVGGRIDVWLCVKCNASNPIDTRYCARCGSALGVDCPECGRINLVSTPYCTNCGIKIKEAVEEQERQRDREELQQVEAQIRRESNQIEDLQRLSRRVILPTTFSKDRALYNDFSEPVGCMVSGSIMLLMMLGV